MKLKKKKEILFERKGGNNAWLAGAFLFPLLPVQNFCCPVPMLLLLRCSRPSLHPSLCRCRVLLIVRPPSNHRRNFLSRTSVVGRCRLHFVLSSISLSILFPSIIYFLLTVEFLCAGVSRFSLFYFCFTYRPCTHRRLDDMKTKGRNYWVILYHPIFPSSLCACHFNAL